MEDHENGNSASSEVAGKHRVTYYFKTQVEDITIMTADFVFENERPSDIVYNFDCIPMTSYFLKISNNRFFVSMATLDPRWINSVYWFRYLFLIDEANGPSISINRNPRQKWDWIFYALGPKDQWEDLGSEWPNPAVR